MPVIDTMVDCIYLIMFMGTCLYVVDKGIIWIMKQHM